MLFRLTGCKNILLRCHSHKLICNFIYRRINERFPFSKRKRKKGSADGDGASGTETDYIFLSVKLHSWLFLWTRLKDFSQRFKRCSEVMNQNRKRMKIKSILPYDVAEVLRYSLTLRHAVCILCRNTTTLFLHHFKLYDFEQEKDHRTTYVKRILERWPFVSFLAGVWLENTSAFGSNESINFNKQGSFLTWSEHFLFVYSQSPAGGHVTLLRWRSCDHESCSCREKCAEHPQTEQFSLWYVRPSIRPSLADVCPSRLSLGGWEARPRNLRTGETFPGEGNP